MITQEAKEKRLAVVWDKYNLVDDEVEIAAKDQNLNFINIVLLRSRLLEKA